MQKEPLLYIPCPGLRSVASCYLYQQQPHLFLLLHQQGNSFNKN